MRLMNNEDRKRVFWLLQKYSSYTVWKTWGDAFQAFTNAWEYAVTKTSPKDQDEFIIGALKEFWDGCTSFDKGLALLKQGNRYIFKNSGNWRIFDTLNYASRVMNERDYDHEWMVNATEVKRLYGQLDDLGYGPGWVTERDNGDSAALNPENVFSTHTWPPKKDYAQFNFPSELADVPAPAAIIIDTGNEVPHDGVWEPEWPDPKEKKSIVVNIRSLLTPVIFTNVQKGCMNYLVAGTIAPTYQNGMNIQNMPVRWRLIWQDIRYKDGDIPTDEASYLRKSPPKVTPPTPPQTIRLRCEAGKQCPSEGYWFTPAKQDSRRHFKQHEVMPAFDGDYGATVWQWDEKQ